VRAGRGGLPERPWLGCGRVDEHDRAGHGLAFGGDESGSGDDNPDAHTTSALYIHVDVADELAADWRKAGMEVLGPENEGYGKREGQHVDPDGNLIRFGGPPRQPNSS